MRLVELLKFLLSAHGDTLRRLAALLGEDALVMILEDLPEDPRAHAPLPRRVAGAFHPPHQAGRPLEPGMGRTLVPISNPYQELENTVREMKLPAVLEFYVWAFPLYRSYIESGLDLNSRLPSPADDRVLEVVDDAIQESRNWVRRLAIPPHLGLRADQATKNPWLKFRSDVLRGLGSRPMQVLS